MNLQVDARNVQVKCLEDVSAAALEAAVQAWLDALTTERLLGIEYQSPASNQHSALILYTR